MIEKIVRARKEYICDNCGEIIQKGELHFYYKFKVGKFDEACNQVGVEYVESRQHDTDCVDVYLEELLNE